MADMSWILIIVLIGKMAGSTNSVTTARFSSSTSCAEAVQRLQAWNVEASQTYPTDTPHVHAFCIEDP